MSGSVPPSGSQPTSSTPLSKGGKPEEKRKSKDFKMPSKGGQEKVKEKDVDEKKKKGLFDLAGADMAIKEKEPGIQQQLKAENLKTDQISAADAAKQVSQIGKLVQNVVQSMKIGQVDGKNFASLNLKETSSEVPVSFAGSNLTLSYQAGALKVHFDNFMTAQQENNAITLVEKNKEQLEQMVRALQAKNIQITELSIGSHIVALPPVRALPPPFQASSPEQGSQQREREQQGGGEGGREGGGQGGKKNPR